MTEQPQAEIRTIDTSTLPPETRATVESLQVIRPEAIREIDPAVLTWLSLRPIKDRYLLPDLVATLRNSDVVEASAFIATSRSPWDARTLPQVDQVLIQPLIQWRNQEIERLNRFQTSPRPIARSPQAFDRYLEATSPIRFQAGTRLEAYLSDVPTSFFPTDAGTVRIRAIGGDLSTVSRLSDPFFGQRKACPLGETIIKNAARSAIISAEMDREKQAVFQALCTACRAEMKWWNLNNLVFALEVSQYQNNRQAGYPETAEEVADRPLLLDLWTLLSRYFPGPESSRFIFQSFQEKLGQQREISNLLLDYAEIEPPELFLPIPTGSEEITTLPYDPVGRLRAWHQRMTASIGWLASQADRQTAGQMIYESYSARDLISSQTARIMVQEKEMAVLRAPIRNNQLAYYGRRIKIESDRLDPEQTYSATEVAVSLLIIRDDQGNLIGAVDLEPVIGQKQPADSYPLLAPAEAINRYLKSGQKHTDQEIAAFLANYEQVYHPDSQLMRALSQAEINPAVLPLDARIEIANFLATADTQETRQVYQAISRLGIDAMFTLAAADGDRDRFIALLDFCLGTESGFAQACCHLIAEVESLSWEMGIGITPESRQTDTRAQTYSHALIRNIRAIAADIAARQKAGPLSQQDQEIILLSLLYHREAIIALRYRALGLEYPTIGINWERIQDLEATYGRWPGIFTAVLFYQNALAAAWEAGIRPEESAQAIETAYGALTVDIFEHASQFTADTKQEIAATAAVISTLVGPGIAGVKLPTDIRGLDAGCALGDRVTGPVLRQLEEQGIKTEMTGIDLRKSVLEAAASGRLDPALTGFIHSDIAYLPRLLPGKTFDLALSLWSASLDPQERTSQIKFYLGIAKALKQGGVLVLDLAPLVEVPSKIRSHYRSAQEYHQKHPDEPVGRKPPPPEYRTGQETDERPDALVMTPYSLMGILEKIGLKLINTDPETLRQQIELVRNGDLAFLFQETAVQKRVLYLTSSGWLRACLILVKQQEPEASPDPDIQELLAEMAEEPIPPSYREVKLPKKSTTG